MNVVVAVRHQDLLRVPREREQPALRPRPVALVVEVFAVEGGWCGGDVVEVVLSRENTGFRMSRMRF